MEKGLVDPVRRLATSLHYPNGMPGLRAGLSFMWSQPPLHYDPTSHLLAAAQSQQSRGCGRPYGSCFRGGKGKKARAFADEFAEIRAFADEIQRQIRAFKEELNALKVASNQSRAISLESAFGLAWMRTMQ